VRATITKDRPRVNHPLGGTDLVPRHGRRWTAAGNNAHERAHHKPRGENDDKTDKNGRKDLVGLVDLPYVSPGGHMLKARPREEDGRKKDREINAIIEDILGQQCEVTDRLATAGTIAIAALTGLRNDRNHTTRSHYKRRGNNEKRHQYRKYMPTRHGDIVA